MPPPRGGGALLRNLSDNSAHSEASLSGQNATQNAGGAATENGHLNLSPETDKVVYTTETGIEIKSHNLSASGAESSIQYFTLGAYNGTPVNWLIVGTSNQMAENATDAGALINAAAGNGKLVTGATSSDLLENQILCISEYAFEQETYNPNFVARGSFVNSFYYQGVLRYFTETTDSWTDYYANYTTPAEETTSLLLGTTLGIKGYYGNGSGKIVTNSTFSNNYVFSLTTSYYTTFVSVTKYHVPYLFSERNQSTNLYVHDMKFSGLVSSRFDYGGQVSEVCGTGRASAYIDVISSAGITERFHIADFVAKGTSTDRYPGDYRLYLYRTDYSVTNYSISLAYRPAFVMQL